MPVWPVVPWLLPPRDEPNGIWVLPVWWLPWALELSESTLGSSLLAMLESWGPALVEVPWVFDP